MGQYVAPEEPPLKAPARLLGSAAFALRCSTELCAAPIPSSPPALLPIVWSKMNGCMSATGSSKTCTHVQGWVDQQGQPARALGATNSAPTE